MPVVHVHYMPVCTKSYSFFFTSFYSYVFAKTSLSGLTVFYALFLNSSARTARFEYHPEGLDSGFRSLEFRNVNFTDATLHHFAVSVFGSSVALFVDGVLHNSQRRTLVATLEDGPGTTLVGRRLQSATRYSGLMHSLLYFSSTLSDNEITALAYLPPALHIQPECVCPPSHPVAQETTCRDPTGTSQISRVNTESHNVTYINDDNMATWWQSANGDAPVNITLSLGGLRGAIYVGIFFRSLLPQAMVLHYSNDDGVSFTPRQYYSSDCSMFGLPNNGLLRSPSDVNCVTAHSLPFPNRVVEFRVLDVGNRPETENYFLSANLQQFAQATHVRLELLNWNTAIEREQHFAINEISVYGQACVCNGHSASCDDAVCRCEHNTAGPNCDQCLPLYNDKPWAAGTTSSANPCEICDCNNHSDACVYDPVSDSGVCTNCIDNTAGNQCESCDTFFYNPSGVPFTDPNACLSCDCNQMGVTNTTDCGRGDNPDGTDSGQCACKPSVTGQSCDLCVDGYYNLQELNEEGCEPCLCDTLGTLGGSTTCDMDNGQCMCKQNVAGRNCSRCVKGHFGIENEDGCQPCHHQCVECVGSGPTNCLVSTVCC